LPLWPRPGPDVGVTEISGYPGDAVQAQPRKTETPGCAFERGGDGTAMLDRSPAKEKAIPGEAAADSEPIDAIPPASRADDGTGLEDTIERDPPKRDRLPLEIE